METKKLIWRERHTDKDNTDYHECFCGSQLIGYVKVWQPGANIVRTTSIVNDKFLRQSDSIEFSKQWIESQFRNFITEISQ